MMKYLRRRRLESLFRAKGGGPLEGVANLFDLALVFIVALLLSLMAMYQVLDFFDPKSEITIMKRTEGEWRIITKKGKEIHVRRVTDRKIGGKEGIRLGTAYRLKDGRVIYIPDEVGDEKT